LIQHYVDFHRAYKDVLPRDTTHKCSCWFGKTPIDNLDYRASNNRCKFTPTTVTKKNPTGVKFVKA